RPAHDRAALRLHARRAAGPARRPRGSARRPGARVPAHQPADLSRARACAGCRPLRGTRARPGSRAMNLPYPFAKRRGVLLLEVAGDAASPVRVGLREGADPGALLEVRRAAGRPLRLESLAHGEFDRRLSELYAAAGLAGDVTAGALDASVALGQLAGHIPAAADLLDTRDDAPVIRLINGIIAEGARRGASDIHIEPFESSVRVRLRVDGVMREAARLPARIAPLLVSRVKVMARLDIAERRVPQDGRITVAMGTRSLDVRVSTL